jgi:hypothetical protein
MKRSLIHLYSNIVDTKFPIDDMSNELLLWCTLIRVIYSKRPKERRK